MHGCEQAYAGVGPSTALIPPPLFPYGGFALPVISVAFDGLKCRSLIAVELDDDRCADLRCEQCEYQCVTLLGLFGIFLKTWALQFWYYMDCSLLPCLHLMDDNTGTISALWATDLGSSAEGQREA